MGILTSIVSSIKEVFMFMGGFLLILVKIILEHLKDTLISFIDGEIWILVACILGVLLYTIYHILIYIIL